MTPGLKNYLALLCGAGYNTHIGTKGERHMAWDLTEAASWYRKQGAPADQNALICLLLELQNENGGAIPAPMLAPLAQALDTKESLLLALIRRVPRLRLAQQHVLELCCGPNCSKRGRLAEFVEKTYGAKPEGFSVKFVPCMRLCGKGPNIRWDGQIYHNADEALIKKLIGQ